MHIMCVRAYTLQARLARTIYIRCIYGNVGREITNYTVIYGAYIRFWPTLVTSLVSPGDASVRQASSWLLYLLLSKRNALQ